MDLAKCGECVHADICRECAEAQCKYHKMHVVLVGIAVGSGECPNFESIEDDDEDD
jgi:hypothetical protein